MKLPRRAKVILAFLTVVALLFGWAAIDHLRGGGVGEDTSNEAPSLGLAIRPVDVSVAEVRPVERAVEAVGSLLAMEEVTLRVKVAGRLDAVRVDLGDNVEKDDVVALIEREDYELEMRRAEAQLEQARARLGIENEGTQVEIDETSVVRQARATLHEAQRRLERLEQLSEPGIVSQADLDAAEVAVEVAEGKLEDAYQEARHRLATLAERRAALAIAEQDLKETVVRAPFSGAVTRRVADSGEYLQVGEAVLALVRTDVVRLRLEVPERFASRVAVGQPIRFQMDQDGEYYAAAIERMSPVIEPGSRMLAVEAAVANRGILRPGSFVRGQIVVDETDSAVTVPAAAVTSFAGIFKVFTVEDGLAVEREVALGQRGDGWVEVRGLEAGEVVVLDPGNLRAGTEVRPTAPAASATAALRKAR